MGEGYFRYGRLPDLWPNGVHMVIGPDGKLTPEKLRARLSEATPGDIGKKRK